MNSENLASRNDASRRMPRPSLMLAPRLLTAGQAATYLGYTSPDVLRHIPVGPLRLTGPGAQPRWDRNHIDAYLDSLSNIAASAETPELDDEAVFAELRARRAQ